MAITPADVLEPNGDLTLDSFPGRTMDGVNALLAAYIADGYQRAARTVTLTAEDRDRAAVAWCYARANRNILQRLSRNPASVTLTNEGATTMLAEQIRTFKESATRWEAEFDSVTAAAATPDETPTASARNRYIF